MRFKPGHPKPPGSGRKKGQVSKQRVLRVEQYLAVHNINPIEELLKLLPDLKPADQARLWKDLIPYIEPRKMAVPEPPSIDVTPASEALSAVNDTDFQKLITNESDFKK